MKKETTKTKRTHHTDPKFTCLSSAADLKTIFKHQKEKNVRKKRKIQKYDKNWRENTTQNKQQQHERSKTKI